MNLTEVKKSLERQQFAREPAQGSARNIVFWYDEEGVFAAFTTDETSLDLLNFKIDSATAVSNYVVTQIDSSIS